MLNNLTTGNYELICAIVNCGQGSKIAKRAKDYGITGSTIALGDDGTFHSSQSNAFQLTVPHIERYLRQGTSGYKNNCRLYVKVTSTVYLYGQPRTSTSWAGIDLRQRQLFDMN